jgi:hypothetical protein
MADEHVSLSAARVITLSPESLRAVLADLSPTAACISVASAYEAAAEILAAPAAALVIDLRMMAVRHLRLLQIARVGGAEVLAIGGIPSGLTAEDLSGVRLIARAELRAALEAVLRSREVRHESAAGPEEERPAQVAEEPEEGEYVPVGDEDAAPAASNVEPPCLAGRQVPEDTEPEVSASERGRGGPPPQVEPPAPRRYVPPSPPSARPAGQAPPANPATRSENPRCILTPEEVDALLEDKP